MILLTNTTPINSIKKQILNLLASTCQHADTGAAGMTLFYRKQYWPLNTRGVHQSHFRPDLSDGAISTLHYFIHKCICYQFLVSKKRNRTDSCKWAQKRVTSNKGWNHATIDLVFVGLVLIGNSMPLFTVLTTIQLS